MTFSDLNKLSAKNKITLWAALFFIACAAICYFLIRPTIKTIIGLHKDILNAKIEAEQRITNNSKVNKINDKLEKIEPQAARLNQIFMNKNREIEFITTLEDIAGRNRIAQKLNLSANSSAENGYTVNSLEIIGQGGYLDALNYLRDLEKLSYYININTLDFTRQTTNSNKASSTAGAVNIRINGNTYWK